MKIKEAVGGAHARTKEWIKGHEDSAAWIIMLGALCIPGSVFWFLLYVFK